MIDFTPPAGETADPGCSSAQDNNEVEGEPDPTPECSNGFDDDGDGLIDFTPPVGETADPDCSSAADLGEQGDPLPECSNGFDDDGDGLIDFTPPAGETADPDRSSAADTRRAGGSAARMLQRLRRRRRRQGRLHPAGRRRPQTLAAARRPTSTKALRACRRVKTRIPPLWAIRPWRASDQRCYLRDP